MLALSPLEAGREAGLCAWVATQDPRVRCAQDTTAWRGAERPRVIFGWRSLQGSVPTVTLAQPLRAMARVGDGICLVSAQRTLRTLDLVVQSSDPAALGRALARMTVAPGLGQLIVVRTEPVGGGLRATLSWPVEQSLRDRGELGDDPWPARCDGAQRVPILAVHGTVPSARLRLTGSRASGAILSAGRAEWLLTVGDVIDRWTVDTIDARGVRLRAPGRVPNETIVVRFAPP